MNKKQLEKLAQESEKRSYCKCGSCWWCNLKLIKKHKGYGWKDEFEVV